MSVFKDIDLVIHSGDCSNYMDPYKNEQEVRNFIEWYKTVPVPNKIYVAGNHDTSIEKRLITKADFTANGVIYLENESIEINGFKIWGSPYTPKFGDWAFMKDRHKISKLWAYVPDDTDILITHGPPKGILDLAYDKGVVKSCGDRALLKRINKINPKLVCFGHMHDDIDINNSGMKCINNTIYSNGVCVRNNNGIVQFINKSNFIQL